MTQARRVRLVLRRIEPWTVLKFSLLLYASLYLVLLVAAVTLWAAASVTGLRGSVESFVGDLVASKDFHFKGGELLRASIIGGTLLVLVGSGVTVLLSVLHNLISDLIGGFGVVFEERPTRGARPRPTRPPPESARPVCRGARTTPTSSRSSPAARKPRPNPRRVRSAPRRQPADRTPHPRRRRPRSLRVRPSVDHRRRRPRPPPPVRPPMPRTALGRGRGDQPHFPVEARSRDPARPPAASRPLRPAPRPRRSPRGHRRLRCARPDFDHPPVPVPAVAHARHPRPDLPTTRQASPLRPRRRPPPRPRPPPAPPVPVPAAAYARHHRPDLDHPPAPPVPVPAAARRRLATHWPVARRRRNVRGTRPVRTAIRCRRRRRLDSHRRPPRRRRTANRLDSQPADPAAGANRFPAPAACRSGASTDLPVTRPRLPEALPADRRPSPPLRRHRQTTSRATPPGRCRPAPTRPPRPPTPPPAPTSPATVPPARGRRPAAGRRRAAGARGRAGVHPLGHALNPCAGPGHRR